MFVPKLLTPASALLMVISSLPHASVSVVAFSITSVPQHQLNRDLASCHKKVRPASSLFESSSSSSFDDDFVDMQKKVGENDADADADAKKSSIESHLRHQQEVFDEMSGFFNSEEATPEEVKPILRFLTKKIVSDLKMTMENNNDDDGKKIFDILDVGCGTGALFPYYLQAADEMGVGLNIVGVDLSPKMVECANENASKIVAASSSSDNKHSIQCEVGDFVQRVMGTDCNKETLTGFDDGVLDENTDKLREKFDAVVINACFGNFFDSDSVFTAAAKSLKNDGSFVISHPLGSKFVEKLSSENPSTVPHHLPTESKLDELLQFQPMVKSDFIEEVKASDDNTKEEEELSSIYYASSKRVPHTILREVLRLRGSVDEGYGRGGKKLGFPTANLPSSLFSNALANVPTGVYMGWAVIEASSNQSDNGDIVKQGRNVIHKVVVNVGYSPTFEGKENKEKIVEGHLIVGDGDIEGDFYGETMRLALCGFLRPEKRFPSFPDLIAAITNDVANAKKFLDFSPYSQFREDTFFQVGGDEKWVGSSGGNDNASYEFESTSNFLEGKKIE